MAENSFTDAELRSGTLEGVEGCTECAHKIFDEINKWDILLVMVTLGAMIILYWVQGWVGILDKVSSVIIFAGLTTLALKPMLAKSKINEKHADKN